MSRTLSNIKDSLRRKIGRGASLDDQLYDFISDAITFIERKRNFNYMYHLQTTTLDPDATYPRTLRIDSVLVKAIDFFRLVPTTTGPCVDFDYLEKVTDARDMKPPQVAKPDRYLQTQQNLLFLNNTPDVAYDVEVGWWELTSLSSGDSTSHPLFDSFRDGLIHLALYMAANETRDYQRAAAEKALFEDAFEGLIAMEEDMDLQNTEYVMNVPIDG
jgi:hypothetical protein